jgi:hypothetical protein
LKEEEIPGELLEGVKQMIVGFKRLGSIFQAAIERLLKRGLSRS